MENTYADFCLISRGITCPMKQTCEDELKGCSNTVAFLEDSLKEKEQAFANVVLNQPETSWVDSSSWQFNEVSAKVSLPEGFELVLADHDGFVQYTLKETETEKLYSTCVFFADDAQKVCPQGAQCGATSTNGWPNAVAKKLKEALRRNNFRHEYCASLREVCDFWPTWWQETLVEKMDISTNQIPKERAERMSRNICVGPTNELLYVTKDELKRTCVGFGDHKEKCDPKR